MLRGSNKQRIFHDTMDYSTWLQGLRKYRDLCGFTLYAYCLLPNHIHLLIRENAQGESISQVMKRLATWYVYRYNLRYERSGALFEDRYKSEAVENDAYFLKALRYIHRNPVKAGIVNEPGLYAYSSYAEYASPHPEGLVETSLLHNYIPQVELPLWHMQEDGISFLDITERAQSPGISDDRALAVMQKVSGAANVETFKRLDDQITAKTIKRMRKSGASFRQIVRLSGVSMAMVRKTLSDQQSI